MSRNISLKNLLMISSLFFLNACGCSGGNDACVLLPLEVMAVVAAPVVIVVSPVIWATRRGPEPQIDSKNNRIQLEHDVDPATTVASLQNSEREAHHLKDDTFRRLRNTVTWQNFGPENLSGSHMFDGSISEITVLPNSNMAVIPVTQQYTPEKKSKIFLLDLPSNQVKFEIPFNDSFIDTVASPDGNYLLVFSLSGFGPHQIDVYGLMNFTYIGSISTGEHYRFGYPIFESGKNRFTTYIRDKVYIFNITNDLMEKV